MAKFEIHNDHGPIYTIGEPSSGQPEKWAPMEVVPNIADIPDDLRKRYERIMPEFRMVQDELGKLYDQGTPANAVRP